MGKTPTPLKIIVARELMEADPGVWAELAKQGHEITLDEGEYDIAFGPRCWRLFPKLSKYIPLALKEARAAKKKKVPRGT
jgi:hypothetical protein